jgi:hypothetical protein
VRQDQKIDVAWLIRRQAEQFAMQGFRCARRVALQNRDPQACADERRTIDLTNHERRYGPVLGPGHIRDRRAKLGTAYRQL